MRYYPHTLASVISDIAQGPKNLILGDMGIMEDGTVTSDANMQLILVQTSTWTVTDSNDPFDRPDGTTITSTLYAARGTFSGDLDYRNVSGGVIDTSVGSFSVYGELSSDKSTYTSKTASELLSVFKQTGGDDKHKAFYVGVSFTEDTVDEMQPVDVVRVVEDFILNCVVVTVKKRGPA